MKLPGRPVVRLLIPAVLAMLLAPTAPSPEPAPATPSITPAGEDPTAKGETRLRKLHLVRPDLIPYPIAYEVYC